MFDLDLPINALLDDISSYLSQHSTLVIEAPPGAGKTTIVPLALMQAPWLEARRIVMLQPRRIAARNAALRMADLLGEKPGERVGYRMRLDTRVSAHTRIEIVTEGILLRMLQDDPSLDDVGLLIFDEFHERSLDADLGLALALKARETFERENALRIVVMSATLDERQLAAFLNAPCIRSDGRLHPVEEIYGRPSEPRERTSERAAPIIQQALRDHPRSSVLVFLPGQGEISRVMEQLHTPPDVTVYPLFGNLSIEEQQAAIAPSEEGQRKVVLATNIAETSLTIDGVDVVIDSGLERRPAFDPSSGMSRLETVRISRASSEQRKGRAGRLRPGSCYRLWSSAQQEQLSPQQEPEILNADLASLVLQIYQWGVFDPRELQWLTAPPPGAYQQAIDLLTQLGAINTTSSGPRLSDYGSVMANLAMHPRLAHMLLAGQAIGAPDTAALLAAVLSDRDPISRRSPDMRLRIEYLSGETTCPGEYRGWMHRTQQLAGQFQRQLPVTAVEQLPRPTREQLIGYLITCAYPDRIARQRHSGGFQLANGRSCQFASPNAMSKSKWLAVAEVSGMRGGRGDTIRAAAPLDPALFNTLLSEQISTATVVDWDSKTGRFIAEDRRSCGALLLGSKKLDTVSDAQRIDKLLELTRAAELSNLSWAAETREFLARARLMSEFDDSWPSFTPQSLLDELEIWLSPYLAQVRKLDDLKRLPLLEALRARTDWAQQQRLDEYLPERYTAPSGSRIKIDYRESPPILPVKLQEMFGCESTPTIARGRLALLVHLLSPAGRPLQVTQDLAGFWRSGYSQVKKEMKGRYPKHPWPDDPINASPTRHTKNRSS